jgi:hypothetical protein
VIIMLALPPEVLPGVLEFLHHRDLRALLPLA